MNSSPPYRAAMSPGRTQPTSRRATSHKTRSPTKCPKLVVDRLEAVEVDEADGEPVALLSLPALRRSIQPAIEQPAVGQAGQRIVAGQAQPKGLRLQLPGSLRIIGGRQGTCHDNPVLGRRLANPRYVPLGGRRQSALASLHSANDYAGNGDSPIFVDHGFAAVPAKIGTVPVKLFGQGNNVLRRAQVV